MKEPNGTIDPSKYFIKRRRSSRREREISNQNRWGDITINENTPHKILLNGLFLKIEIEKTKNGSTAELNLETL